ncbi:hypothetical protein LTR37_002716 [Vermiconidia calcicola]|uniref:Uncharacterized protein n=1 Tax=Vermiconidia calcicola TaxID=1690605 RepID=A0ACC3NSN8_9PEZI|nr:hypothetical protein LTR37_002716 [Vermiconidia calcicola]
MGKPRLIILVRHAQSEGNKNRAIHQIIPDHRVKLTEEGHKQAEEAGRRLRRLLRPDDTLQVFTSPYRRTRETTEGILKTLTSTTEDGPSPFSRSKIKVYEEPRLREQDFGNFQPCSAEMERMWRERADYGHFFYRIPNGESAADAYDRISGFNESLWRQFGEREFPSVLVLVTHGLMTRVFLMKWYHWSVEYFEDLRNVNHCEFVVMKMGDGDRGKYVLESQLRTWSELKRLRAEEAEAAEEARRNPSRRNTLSAFLSAPAEGKASPGLPARKWGGCVEGCDHHHEHFPRRTGDVELPPPAAEASGQPAKNENDDHALGPHEPAAPNTTSDGAADGSKLRPLPSYLYSGRDGGGTSSGAATPHEMPSDEEESESFPFPGNTDTSTATSETRPPRAMATAMRKTPQRKPTPEDIERWTTESGMGAGRHADALGDEPEPADEDDVLSRRKREVDQAEREDKSLRGSVY